jgi:membrane protein YdbS with pleckstrin-like domain
MFPKKGQVWTYRERGRFLSLLWMIPIIAILIAGIYFVSTDSNWLLLILGIVALAGLAMFIFSSERSHRGEP